MIIAGWDERHGGQVYSIPLGGSLHKQSYAIGGSGSTYIYGYCDANWKENMEETDAVNFVKGALEEAIKWDGSSGGVIRMVSVFSEARTSPAFKGLDVLILLIGRVNSKRRQ